MIRMLVCDENRIKILDSDAGIRKTVQNAFLYAAAVDQKIRVFILKKKAVPFGTAPEKRKSHNVISTAGTRRTGCTVLLRT